mmetsp:Transcript_103526/g.302104  ORF Transcript_103526/g.302104 Transcript_103526/m.302104 type:complete len:224 (-) Transcript_103526:71-742(-)
MQPPISPVSILKRIGRQRRLWMLDRMQSQLKQNSRMIHHKSQDGIIKMIQRHSVTRHPRITTCAKKWIAQTPSSQLSRKKIISLKRGLLLLLDSIQSQLQQKSRMTYHQHRKGIIKMMQRHSVARHPRIMTCTKTCQPPCPQWSMLKKIRLRRMLDKIRSQRQMAYSKAHLCPKCPPTASCRRRIMGLTIQVVLGVIAQQQPVTGQVALPHLWQKIALAMAWM